MQPNHCTCSVVGTALSLCDVILFQDNYYLSSLPERLLHSEVKSNSEDSDENN